MVPPKNIGIGTPSQKTPARLLAFSFATGILGPGSLWPLKIGRDPNDRLPTTICLGAKLFQQKRCCVVWMVFQEGSSFWSGIVGSCCGKCRTCLNTAICESIQIWDKKLSCFCAEDRNPGPGVAFIWCSPCFHQCVFEQFPSLDLVCFESNKCLPITFKHFLNVERFEFFQHFTRSVCFSPQWNVAKKKHT